MSNISCGIDFGTTNSSAAVAKGNLLPKLVEVEGNEVTIPSTIFFEAKKNTPSFGRDAMKRYMQGDQGRFMRSLKRILGTDLMSGGTRVNDRMMKFDEIIASFLANMKNKIDNNTGANIEDVVMGRPVHFRDNDPKGDKQAEEELRRIAQKVGFKNVEFQFEPIAAAFAHENKMKKEQLACVVDIGGGTSDFTIIRLGPSFAHKTDRKDDILASTGIRIGGNDFDKQLSIKSFMPELGLHSTYGEKALSVPTHVFFELSEWSQVNSVYNYKNLNMIKKYLFQSHDKERYGRLLELVEKEQGHTLLAATEATKIQLTERDKVNINLNFLSDAPTIKTDRQKFEESIENDVLKISKSVEECMKLAQIKPNDVQLIVLTGGSTEIPYIQETVLSHFSNAELSQENKLSSVGLGLAYDSARRFGGNAQANFFNPNNIGR